MRRRWLPTSDCGFGGTRLWSPHECYQPWRGRDCWPTSHCGVGQHPTASLAASDSTKGGFDGCLTPRGRRFATCHHCNLHLPSLQPPPLHSVIPPSPHRLGLHWLASGDPGTRGALPPPAHFEVGVVGPSTANDPADDLPARSTADELAIQNRRGPASTTLAKSGSRIIAWSRGEMIKLTVAKAPASIDNRCPVGIKCNLRPIKHLQLNQQRSWPYFDGV
jgi:hypothetical protein